MDGLGGYEKKMAKNSRELDVILQGLIDEHRSNSKKGLMGNNTMIDHLLSLQKSEPEYYTDQIIKGVTMVSETLLYLLFGTILILDFLLISEFLYAELGFCRN